MFCHFLMRMIRIARTVFFPIVACIALSACQNMPTLPGMSMPGAPAIDPVKPLPPASSPVRQWPDAEKDVLVQRAKFYGLVNMPDMQAYLNKLLSRIKQVAGHPDWPGQVYILATPSLDAYATGAGNIYISQAWLQNIASEDEIVALLSHEFGHIYLHYHQLEGVINTSDQLVQSSAGVYALIKKTAQSQGWGQLDTLMASYALGRDWISSAWGRSQETAADSFGLNVSLQLGYAYEAGFKTLLERLSAWEDQQAETEARNRQAILDEVKRQAAAASLQKSTSSGSKPTAVDTTFAGLTAELTGIAHQLSGNINTLFKSSVDFHPDTLARINTQIESIEPYADTLLGRTAQEAPWRRARTQPRTAATLKNYALAIAALGNLQSPTALSQAQQSVQKPTATHALPLLALYRATLASHPAGNRNTKDPGAILMNNIKAVDDRAWQTYVERATMLSTAGKQREAQDIMRQGLAFFNNSPEAWVQSITFTGENLNWATAKEMAKTCSKLFPQQSSHCDRAAATPQERQQAEAQAERKAKSLVGKWLK